MDGGRGDGGTWFEAPTWARPQDGGGAAAPGVQTGGAWPGDPGTAPGGGARPLPPEPPRRRLPPWAVRLGLALVVLAASIGWSAWRSADRDDSGAVVDGGDLDVFQVQQGDCLSTGDGEGSVSTVTAVPCDQPHESEVYALVDHPADEDAEFPGEDAVGTFADGECVEAFATYVGAQYEDSQYGIATFVPSPESWADGDREVVCMATDGAGGELTGSVRGSAQ